MIIAIDFDGTIVEHQYPKIGKPISHAIETILKLSESGHRLLLWTYRHGTLLDDAVAYCEDNGIHFYAVNKIHPNEELIEGASRLIKADVYIDDRNIGGLPDWLDIQKKLC